MRYPLDQVEIRTALHEQFFEEPDRLNIVASPVGGAFGKVRSSGSKPHQGWDMYAPVYAPAYAIAGSLVVSVCTSFGPEQYKKNSFGNFVCLMFGHEDPKRRTSSQLFAFYGHLASVEVDVGDCCPEGSVIGTVGRSGNASRSPSHLHFEIRTVANPPAHSGLKYRIDPGEVLGYKAYSCRT